MALRRILRGEWAVATIIPRSGDRRTSPIIFVGFDWVRDRRRFGADGLPVGGVAVEAMRGGADDEHGNDELAVICWWVWRGRGLFGGDTSSAIHEFVVESGERGEFIMMLWLWLWASCFGVWSDLKKNGRFLLFRKAVLVPIVCINVERINLIGKVKKGTNYSHPEDIVFSQTKYIMIY